MHARTLARSAVIAFALLASTGTAQHGAALAAPQTATATARFIENLGQWPELVRFAADMHGMTVRAECGALGFHAQDGPCSGRYVRLAFLDARGEAEPEGLELLPGVHHWYLGNDPSRWRTNGRAFGGVRYRDLYPGVDLVLRAGEHGPKYDLLLAAGVHPQVVRVRWEGVLDVDLAGGAVHAALPVQPLVELPAVAWQIAPEGTRIPIEVTWLVSGPGELTLSAPHRDQHLPLVVDPDLLWSTYLGSNGSNSAVSNGDRCVGAATDRDGDVYVISTVDGNNFPVTPGGYNVPVNIWRVCGATKLRGATGAVVYSAVFGGQLHEQRPLEVAADEQERALIVGWSRAADFPTTPGAFDTVHAGLDYPTPFVLRLSQLGDQLEFSTFLVGHAFGGSFQSITPAPDGGVVLGGGVGPDFPLTGPVIGNSDFGAFGHAVIVKLDSTGSTLLLSRAVGGSLSDFFRSVDMDDQGRLVVVGYTQSTDFPTTPGAYQTSVPNLGGSKLVVCKLAPINGDLVWSTYVASTMMADNIQADISLGVDGFGCPIVNAGTRSQWFPTTPGVIQPSAPAGGTGGVSKSVLFKLAHDGSRLLFSTYLSPQAGHGLGPMVVDAAGLVTLLGGVPNSLPATPGAYDDVFGPGYQFQIVRVDPGARRYLHLTHIGGPTMLSVEGLAVSAHGRVTVVGGTVGPGGVPITPGAFQTDYAGGYSDGFVTTLDLGLHGVANHGRSTHACRGPLNMAAYRMPSSGAQDFGFYCSGAPENARGVLILGALRPAPVAFGGASVFVDSGRLVRVQTDEYGYVETDLPLPDLPVGATFAAQYAFLNQQECLGSGRLSASQALRLTVQ